MAARDPRRQMIAKVKMAQKDRDLDDDAYRDLLRRVTGKNSCARMGLSDLDKVIAEFRRLGWEAKPSKAAAKGWPGRPKNTDQVPMLRKVEALLADARRPWDYAHATAKHMFGTDRLEFLTHDQLHRLVAALQVDANRRK